MVLWLLTVVVACVAALAFCRTAPADEQIALLASTTTLKLSARRVDGSVFVPAGPLLGAFDATIEPVSEGSVSVCVGEDVCALVATDGSDRRLRRGDDGWAIEIGSAAELLRAHWVWDDAAETVALVPGISSHPTSVNVGDPFPNVALPSVFRGAVKEPVPLSRFRGKKVVLFTWASW